MPHLSETPIHNSADAPRRQIFSHILVLNKHRCCGLLFEVASSAASSSCIRVVFPRRGREAPFSFAVCLLTRFYSCKPILVDLWFDSHSALPVSIDTKTGRDKPFCFPCVWWCLRPVVLLLCTCGCLVCGCLCCCMALAWMFPSASWPPGPAWKILHRLHPGGCLVDVGWMA